MHNASPHSGGCDGTVAAALKRLYSDPWLLLIRGWNWKSALLSSLLRSSVFFGVNLGAGWRKALGAMLAEFVFRALTSGWCGSITQSFRRVVPMWKAVATLVPALLVGQHSLELLVHWLRGTPRLAASIGASIAFTLISTMVNLALMRHGAFTVGAGSKSLIRDLAGLPRLIGGFFAALAAFSKRLVSGWQQEATRP
jgi:hypothetical protein